MRLLATINVKALSDIIVFGIEYLLANLLNPYMNESTVKFGISSRCAALVDAHMYKQLETFAVVLSVFLMCKGPAKSTPDTENGISSCTRSFGKGGGSGF